MTNVKDELQTRWVRMEVVGTLERGLAVLEALAECSGVQGRTLTEISELVAMNLSTTSRILNTLAEWGYVSRAGDRYKLGLRALVLGKAVLEALDLRQVARPALEELASEVELTCHLGVLDQTEVVYIDKVEPSAPFQMRSRIGDRMPVHCTALGKAALAFSPSDVVESILARPLRAQTARTVVDPAELKQQCAEIHRRGFAIDDQENEEGVMCVAAPVFDHRGRLHAVVSVSGPAFLVGGERLSELGGSVCQAALSISSRLGYRTYIDGTRPWPVGRESIRPAAPGAEAAEADTRLGNRPQRPPVREG